MIAEELNSKQITEKILNRVDIWRDWFYENIRKSSVRYPKSYTIGDTVSCSMLVYPNETSEVNIHILTSDNDGGGLDANDGLAFALQYTTSDDATNPKTHPMFSVDLKDYPKYKLYNNDSSRIAHIFPLNKKFKLSKIPNYEKIRIFNISIKQSKGTEKGNECSLMVNFTQQN